MSGDSGGVLSYTKAVLLCEPGAPACLVSLSPSFPICARGAPALPLPGRRGCCEHGVPRCGWKHPEQRLRACCRGSINAVGFVGFLPFCREPGLAAGKHVEDGAKVFPESCLLVAGLFCFV